MQATSDMADRCVLAKGNLGRSHQMSTYQVCRPKAMHKGYNSHFVQVKGYANRSDTRHVTIVQANGDCPGNARCFMNVICRPRAMRAVHA